MPYQPVQLEDFVEIFATTRYIDFDNGNDANSGLTAAQAWKTFARAIAVEWTPLASTTTTFDQLWICSGTSRGADKCLIDAFSAGRVALNATSRLGLRAWLASDDARPTGAVATRPFLRADTAFSTLTQVSASAVYKSNVIPAGNTDISQVLWKACQASQLDAEGSWKCHLYLTGSGTLPDATIATNLLAAGSNTAYYKTDTREVFVNTTGLNTTAADFSWAFTGTNESASKIQLSGLNLASVDGFDTIFTDRGIVIFDARQVRIRNMRCIENRTHNIMMSYSNWQVKDIIVENCYAAGLGKTNVGGTMVNAGGGAGGTDDMMDVYFRGLTIVRYNLQNPSGAVANTGLYNSYFTGAQTSTLTTNLVRQAAFENCNFYDLSVAKIIQSASNIHALIRCNIPNDPTRLSDYPVIYRNCYFNVKTVILETSLTGLTAEGSKCWAFDNCRIDQLTNCNAVVGVIGFRGAVIFDAPAGYASGNRVYCGVFNKTQWTSDIGNGDAGQRCSIFTFKGDGTIGNVAYFTARGQSILLAKHCSTGQVNLTDQSVASTAGGVDKGLVVDFDSCALGYVTPPGHPNDQNLMCFQDLPATGNAGRKINNCQLSNVTMTNISSSNASFSNWIANVDPNATVCFCAQNPFVSKNPGRNYFGSVSSYNSVSDVTVY